jgi:hypothetical protein
MSVNEIRDRLSRPADADADELALRSCVQAAHGTMAAELRQLAQRLAGVRDAPAAGESRA